MVKLLETSGVIEKTHIVLCAEHGPEQKNGFRFMYARFISFFFLSVDSDSMREKASTRYTTATADHAHIGDEIQAEGRLAAIHFGRILILFFFAYIYIVLCYSFRVILIIGVVQVHGRTQNA